MKKIKIFPILAMLAMLATSLVFTACNDEDDPLPAEALITEFAITNAGAQADERVEGVITGFNILVVVPFETDLTALTTEISLSEGASVVPASGTEVDFTDTRSFVVTNGDESNTYQVTVELAEPTSAVISDITIASVETGEVYASEINQGERSITVTLNTLQSTLVEITDIEIIPAGTTWEATGEEGVMDLTLENSITLSFAGEETVYTIDANITEAGFNPENSSLLVDGSRISDLVPSEIDNENTRGAAFDGRYAFFASRKDGNNIYYWDVEAPGDGPVALAMGDDISGGTWLISDIRVVDGNIYVSNMVMESQQVFKVYKWEGIDDETPELILEYTVSEEGVRLGDAISVIGNPPADGYIFASNFAFPDNASEFYVWNFDNGDVQPTIMPIDPIEGLRMGQYGRVKTIPGEPDLLLVTGAEMGIGIMDYSGNVLAETTEPAVQSRSFDPNIFEYNGGLYLSYTVNREWEGQGAWYEVLNITGADLGEVLTGLTENNIEERRVFKHVFGGPSTLWVGGINGVGFSSDGKPRVMGFALTHGFVVHEFSN